MKNSRSDCHVDICPTTYSFQNTLNNKCYKSYNFNDMKMPKMFQKSYNNEECGTD